MRRSSTICCLGLISVACVTSHLAIPADQRSELETQLLRPGQSKYLRLSFYVTPFFEDGSKLLLSPYPSKDVRLVNRPNGDPLLPGEQQKIIPVGTRARLLRIEFPTSWALVARIIYTPRDRPWLYLEIQGETTQLPFVIVLRSNLSSKEAFLDEVERYLTDDDPASALSKWSPAVQDGVRAKQALRGMTSSALEMAWGYPDLKKAAYQGSVRFELWEYVRRKASFVDGRLDSFEGP